MDYSYNGTFLNSEKVPRDSKTILSVGDVLVFGDFESSALRYRFTINTKDSEFKRPSSDSSVLGSIKFSAKNKKNTPSHSSSTTGSFSSLLQMEIPDLFNYIYLIIDPSIQVNDEFLCVLCKKICLFPIYFPCFHNFCFLCYTQKIFEKSTFCPCCNKKISKKTYPFRNYLLVEAIEKKLDPEVLYALRVLGEKVIEIEKAMQEKIRGKTNAEKIFELESQLPIYSLIWSNEHELQFKESFSQMTNQEKLENMIATGLNSEFIVNADEERIDVVMERLCVFDSSLSLSEKKQILQKMIE